MVVAHGLGGDNGSLAENVVLYSLACGVVNGGCLLGGLHFLVCQLALESVCVNGSGDDVIVLFLCGLDGSVNSVDAVLVYLLDELGLEVALGGTEQHSLLSVGDVQLFLCTGDANVCQSALFFKLLGIVHGADRGEDAVLHANDEHYGELQSLCGVHGHKANCVIICGKLVDIGVEGDLLQESRKSCFFACFGLCLHICGNVGFKFFDVFKTGETLIALTLEHCSIACFLDNCVKQLVKRELVGSFSQVGEYLGSLYKRSGLFAQGSIALGVLHYVDGGQLQVNGEKVGVPVFTMGDKQNPVDIAKASVEHAQKNGNNIVILDTAGRLHIDENMMTELIEIKKNVDVFQSILVVDAMTGQDAVNVAKEFNEKVGVDGIIITKMDGDTRGGAALSIRSVTGKPILYVGMGEKLEDLQQFYPDRMTSRILGMGDVLSLIEKAEQTINEEDALRMTEKMKKAEFDFNDFLDQMDQMKKMGGLSNLLSMIPGVGNKMQGLDIDDSMMDKTAAIIYSMTKEERANPKIINASRKRRIAAGAGVPIAEVNRLCKQVQNQKQMMKQMSGMFGGKGGKRGGFKLPF